MPKLTPMIAPDPAEDGDGILTEQFYGRSARIRAGGKPTHYKIVCISLYTEDIARLEAMVAELKRRGHTKANKSAVIRFALDQVDIGKMPKAY